MNELTAAESKIRKKALAYAKANKKVIARQTTDKNIYPTEDEPVSIFMAGSPGAGKTEASIEFLDVFPAKIIKIDPDELRHNFQAYTGINAYLFQSAVSILVEKIHDFALKQQQSFLLDGTLSKYDIACRNVERSLNKGRDILVLYVYQQPLLAWEFVQARESEEGRRIEKDHFIDQYFSARDVVNRLKGEFGHRVQVDLLVKNADNSTRHYHANINKIDNFMAEKYNRAELVDQIKVS